MKPSHLIVAGLVVLALGGCSKKEETTTSMEKSSEPATQSSTGAMEVIKEPESKAMEPAGETAPQSGESAQMQEPAEPAQQPQ